MKNIVVYLIFALLMILLPACKAEAVSKEPIDYTETIANLNAQLSLQAPQSLALQRKLAQWYNLNLLAQNPEQGFLDTYDSILFYENGIMGYIAIPSNGVCIPIYHGDALSSGFGHRARSAFPIGGEGNHTVLTYSGSVMLEEGDRFEIHILQDVLTYEVRDEAQKGEDLCTLEMGGICYHGQRIVVD